MASIKTRTSWFSLISRGVLFLLIWWVLTDGAASSWWIGVPVVLLAVTVSIGLVPPARFVWFEFIRFVPFFLRHSFLGGSDVARRAFQPRMPIAPDVIEYPMRLPPGLPQVFMANIVNLLPGTLSTEFNQNVLNVHVLDRGTGFLAELEAVEQSVARMFGAPLQVYDVNK